MRGDVTELRRPVWLEGVDGGAGQLLALRTLQGCLGKGQGGWWRYAGLNGVPPPPQIHVLCSQRVSFGNRSWRYN